MLAIDLKGRVALVTGASGGLGRAIATTLAASGARVAAHYRNGDDEKDAAQVVEHAAVTAEPLVAFLLGLGHQQAHEIEIDRAGDVDADVGFVAARVRGRESAVAQLFVEDGHDTARGAFDDAGPLEGVSEQDEHGLVTHADRLHFGSEVRACAIGDQGRQFVRIDPVSVPVAGAGDTAIVLHTDQQPGRLGTGAVGQSNHRFDEVTIVEWRPFLAPELDREGFACGDHLQS